MVHPQPSAHLGLFTDVSNQSIGSCLQQCVDGEWQPLAFFSKKLTPKQSVWPAYQHELLAIYESVKHFRHILEVQSCTIYTDHKPLAFAFTQRRDKLAPIQMNQLTFISEYTTDIQHVSGNKNTVADTMSRIEEISLPIDYQSLAALQNNDEELRQLNNRDTALRLEKMTIPGYTDAVYCDTSTTRPRPFLTPPFRRRAFNQIHNLSYPRARATARLVSERFVWPGVKKDCREWASVPVYHVSDPKLVAMFHPHLEILTHQHDVSDMFTST